MNNKPSVTIGITAYNEEENMGHLIQNLLNQKTDKFTLKNIEIISDGSTDNTRNIISGFKSTKIKFFNSKERLGQNARYMQIINRLKSHYLVLIEADLLPITQNDLDNLVSAMEKSKKQKLGMVVGGYDFAKPENFYQNIIYTSRKLKQNIAKKWLNGENIYWGGGHTIKILSKDFANKINMPLDVPEDAYFYLIAKKLGYKFIRDPNINTHVGYVSSFEDQVRQSDKFLSGVNSLKKYFNPIQIKTEYDIPTWIIVKEVIKYFFISPVWISLYLCTFILDRNLIDKNKLFDPKYKIYASSKNVIKNNMNFKTPSRFVVYNGIINRIISNLTKLPILLKSSNISASEQI